MQNYCLVSKSAARAQKSILDIELNYIHIGIE